MKFTRRNVEFESGNAKPKGDADWILKNGKNMYSELSPETKEFFEFMVDQELLDLVAKRGKRVAAILPLLRIIKHHLFFLILMEHQVILMF